MRVISPLVAGALLVLTGCASSSVPWQNPDIPKEQWSRDWNSCRRWADEQVGYHEDESSSGVFRDYDRNRAKKQTQGYASMCMTDRGYVPLSKK